MYSAEFDLGIITFSGITDLPIDLSSASHVVVEVWTSNSITLFGKTEATGHYCTLPNTVNLSPAGPAQKFVSAQPFSKTLAVQISGDDNYRVVVHVTFD